VDAIVYVLRGFKNDKIINPQGKIDIMGDKEVLELEMIFKDLETVEKRLISLEKEAKSVKSDKNIIKELTVLNKAQEFLKQGKVLSTQAWLEEEKNILKNYQFLSMKQRIFLLNGLANEIDSSIIDIFQKNNWSFLIIDIATELEAADLNKEERVSLGLPAESKINDLIKKSYELLDLITFFTTGEDETRAWTLKKGKKAPQAGGVIHTDFENAFIKAEVINWQDLVRAKGLSKAREKGLIRTEGREYIIQDGDVIEIKSNA
jgi:hypothetical protein